MYIVLYILDVKEGEYVAEKFDWGSPVGKEMW